ncbi:MAG: glycosyltransferase family 39 protein [Verrucomicrobiota bacterium]
MLRSLSSSMNGKDILKWGPTQCSWLLLSIASIVLFAGLGDQPLGYLDEIKTAERSRSYLISEDYGVVQENGQPTFHKPPLYYWITSVLLMTPLDQEFSIRLFSATGGILMLILTIQIGGELLPQYRWSGVLAGCLLLLYGPFVEYSRVGLLDTIAASLFLGMLLCVIRSARGQDRYWYLAAVICILGAVHKTPMALLAWLLALTYFALDPSYRKIFKNKHLWLALGISFWGTLSWPILQIVRFGPEYWEVYAAGELKQLVSRTRNIGFWTYPVWISKKWFLFAALALGGAVWLLISKRPAPYLKMIALLALVYFLITTSLTGHSHRYLFPVLPLFAIIATLTWFQIKSRMPAVAITLLFINAIPCLITTYIHRGLEHENFNDQLSFAKALKLTETQADPIYLISNDIHNAYEFLLFLRFYAGWEGETEVCSLDQYTHMKSTSTRSDLVIIIKSQSARFQEAFPEAQPLDQQAYSPTMRLFRTPALL